MIIGNWPLLMTVLEHVIQHPDQHNQETYVSECGTTRCIAGWTTHFMGYHDAPELASFGVSTGECVLGIEVAALSALAVSIDHRNTVAAGLFDPYLHLSDILDTVAKWADADGFTLTPMVSSEIGTWCTL